MNTDLENVIELMAVPGPPGEEEQIAEVVRGKLLAMGVPDECMVHDDAHLKAGAGKLGNLIVRFDGNGQGEHRLMSTHLDTVPGAVGSKPRLDGGRIVNDAAGVALGSDARAGCAVLLAAARALMARGGDHPPWTFVFFVQEEIGLVGARYLDVSLLGESLPTMGFNYDAADAFRIENKVIGTERMHIDVKGVAAHTMVARRGISAAVIVARALAELADGGWHDRIERPEGAGLANLGVMRGGTGSNVVMPEFCGLMEARSHDKAFRPVILDTWRDAFRRSVERSNAESPDAEGEASVSFTQGPVYEPYDLPEDAPVVQAAMDAVRSAGCDPQLETDDGGQDSAWLVAHGIPTVGLGFGGRQSHSPDEWVDVEQFTLACQVAAELTRQDHIASC
jgi:tripeptide aminopeptidase